MRKIKNHKGHLAVSILTIALGISALMLQISEGSIPPALQIMIYEGAGIILLCNMVSYLTACYYVRKLSAERHYIRAVLFLLINVFFACFFAYIAFVARLFS